MPIVGDVLAQRYRIESLLGAGATASVYLAHDGRLDREVAVKVLTPNLAADAALAERFEREARALAAVSHPAIVAIYDVEPGDPKTGREPFYVLELCEGGSLQDRLNARGRLEPPELVATIAAVGDGLAELHRRGIIHRDVKPHNILYAGDRAKLADFGIARQDSASALTTLTEPGTTVGTLAYLAPELLDGAPASPASDTYALGAVAFQGLTGRLPRRASSIAELIQARRVPMPAPSAAEPALGTAFDDPIMTALGLDPTGRPAPDELGARLVTALQAWRESIHTDRKAPQPPLIAIDPQAKTLPAIPVPSGSPARPTAGGRRAWGGRAGSRSAALLLAGAVVIVATLVGLSGLLTSLPGQSASTSAPVASQASASSPSPIPSISSSPSPSLSTLPSVSPSDTAGATQAALDRVDAAISAARGGKDGLKGKDGNELQGLASDVRAAVDAGDFVAARTAASMLADRTAAVTKEMRDARAQELQDAVAALVATLP